MKHKTFKISTHHFLTVQAEVKIVNKPRQPWWKVLTLFFYNIAFYVGFALIKSISFLLNFIFNFCYYLGFGLAGGADLILKASKSNIRLTKYTLKARFQLLVSPQFSRSIGTFVLLCLVGWAMLGGFKYAETILEAKGKAILQVTFGKFYLEQAKTNLQSANFTEASSNFLQAYNNFQNSKNVLDSVGGGLNKLLNLFPQKRDADNLTAGLGLMSEAGKNLIDFYDTAKQIKFSQEGILTENDTTQTFDALESSLSNAQVKISEANNLVQKINVNNLPKDNRVEFSQLKDQLSALNIALLNFQDIFQIGKMIVNSNPNILLLFANNNELRPVGGFLGTFGSLELNSGQIQKLHISSIYDLDGQLQDKIIPPGPILPINNRWYLRDSNWFPNFPDSAKKITDFYEREGGETPQIIIIITPTFISDLLKVTGPISMPKYNVTLDSDNFVEQAQALSTTNPSDPSHPKQILSDFFPIFLNKLTSLKGDQTKALLQALQDNLNSKQVVAYSSWDDLEQKFSAYNWTDKILDTDRDYLEVVSANLGGTKTDLNIKQDVTLTSTIDSNGEITDDLTIKRTDTLPNMHDMGNRDFLRVFVPPGSQLLQVDGFDKLDFEATSTEGFNTDPDVLNLEKNSVKDVLTNTTIGKESDKEFFGNWIILQGGQSKTIHLTYKLPFKLANVDHYSLMLQKQAGSKNETFNYAINFNDWNYVWQNGIFRQTGSGFAKYSGALEQDQLFGVVLQKK